MSKADPPNFHTTHTIRYYLQASGIFPENPPGVCVCGGGESAKINNGRVFSSFSQIYAECRFRSVFGVSPLESMVIFQLFRSIVWIKFNFAEIKKKACSAANGRNIIILVFDCLIEIIIRQFLERLDIPGAQRLITLRKTTPIKAKSISLYSHFFLISCKIKSRKSIYFCNGKCATNPSSIQASNRGLLAAIESKSFYICLQYRAARTNMFNHHNSTINEAFIHLGLK